MCTAELNVDMRCSAILNGEIRCPAIQNGDIRCAYVLNSELRCTAVLNNGMWLTAGVKINTNWFLAKEMLSKAVLKHCELEKKRKNAKLI